ncbi:hypothetical protein ABIE66_000376 [Peribacillus sp. B2I2]
MEEMAGAHYGLPLFLCAMLLSKPVLISKIQYMRFNQTID